MKFVILHLCIFVNISLLFLPYKSFCADQQYEVCKKASYCGNQSIRFPFFINETTGYCGYPGFKINCINNNVLLMNISEARYKVHQIFYHNNSLIVSSALSLNSGFCNLARIRNLSLPSDGRLELQSTSNLILLSNCTLKSDEKIFKYKVGCDLRKIDADWVLAMKVKDRNLSSATEICKTVVIAPVHYYSEDGDTDYLKLIRNGFDLRWMATNCSNCEASAGICGYEGEPVSKFKCFCKDRPHTGACLAPSKGKLHVKLGLAGALAAGVMITAVLLYIFWSNCSCSKNLILSETGRNDSEKVKAFLKMHGNLTPKRFSYRDIKKMTQSFKSKLGQGGFGGVYKGELPDTRAVAVKILNTSKSDGGEFLNEVASISRTSHVNIVSLLGFYFEGPKRALVYEFMPNGSLEKFISHGKSSSVQLEWKTLNEIALGIARGLEYLHQGCNTRILHLDIKPHNILLDEKFSPKISDFGLAKLCLGKKSIISMLDMRGTPGYIAPEVFSRNFGGVSHKSDVYSYGMMILEMAGAKNNKNEEVNNCSSEKYFPEWIYDSLELDADQIGIDDISNEVEKESRRKMLIVGLWCIQSHPSNRPSMKRVLEMLEGKVESLRIPARPFLEFLEEPPETISTT